MELDTNIEALFPSVTVDLEFYQKLNSILENCGYSPAPDGPYRKAYLIHVFSEGEDQYIPWPDYGRRFPKDAVIRFWYIGHFDYEDELLREQYLECWLRFEENMQTDRIYLVNRTFSLWTRLNEEACKSIFENLQKISRELLQKFNCRSVSIYRDRYDNEIDVPESDLLLVRFGPE